MGSGTRSLPRYQHGGPHPLSRGLGSLPQEPSWTRELGIPERGSVAPMLTFDDIDILGLTPKEVMIADHLREFDRMAEVRAAILETPLRRGRFGRFGRSQADVLEQFARRNPFAPTPSIDHGDRPPGSFESYFPAEPYDARGQRISQMEMEDALLEIMDVDITEQEIALALDDPMFGGPISGTASNAEIDERVYGRRYANKMGEIKTGRDMPWHPERRGWPAGTETWAKLPTEHLEDWRTRGIAGLRKAGASASRAARGAGITALKAVRDRLPAIIAAGAGTALASHPVSALADIALSPAKLGSGGLPEEDPYSSEDKIKYYEDLMSLGGGLDIGQHYPPVLQLSREVNGPSIRSSYPMRHTRR